MKQKRYRFIDPSKVRAAVGGGLHSHPYPAPEKCCGECKQHRYSLDGAGKCSYCREKDAAKVFQSNTEKGA